MKKYRKNSYFDIKTQAPITMVSRYLKGDFRLIRVFVEGYDDVAFWRGIFDDYETDHLKFEISVPQRPDLAKGKRVVMEMVADCDENTILCVDSDFDYIFNGHNEQSRLVNGSPCLFHTYAYATENYLCYPPSLHRVCAKATKNDTLIFDFESFMSAYSQVIYPLFLWYAYSARSKSERAFTLLDFRSSVRLNYLDVANDGESTIDWLERQVDKRIHQLEKHNPDWVHDVRNFGESIKQFGVEPDNVYLFMQGHTLMDNVVIVMLNAVCEKLRNITTQRIAAGTKQGVALKNELSNYNNTLRSVREVLLDNENYKDCFLYERLHADIATYIAKLK